MIFVELARHLGSGWTLAILGFIASIPIAYLYSWTAFRGRREWLCIALVASTAFHMIGFGLVWLVDFAVRKWKSAGTPEAGGKEEG